MYEKDMNAYLFDLDKTVVVGSSVISYEAFDYAFREVYGINASSHEINVEGMTDRQVIATVLRKRGLPEQAIQSKLDEAMEAMTDYVEQNIHTYTTQKVVPGIEDLLKRLKSRGYTGLLTGNAEGIAKAKLNKLGILHYFEFGAFGNLTERRSELVPIALDDLKQKKGATVERENVYVIGDTPRDIQCARENKVKSVAVATGEYSLEELKKHDPDFLFPNFTDTERILSEIAKE